ncbi:UPF0182 family protein [Gloeocapsa sp. PCC 73106]|uniref:UPF0182 family protein n=1 Tax=Gloeocapsa sp. PCC 73106 TaxID=102232 RepID=UPI0002ABBB13|nr:UPF0182 family protein [Gloeocapsa sp. PCC 73106]ELR98889.1 hypothetical protein GLO73106DRAFT_00027270 [Gloeocapsa sp. PCC 73106]
MLAKFTNRVFPLFLIIIAIFLGVKLIDFFIVDILWFQEVGYLNVFLRRLQTQIISAILVFVFSSLFLLSNLALAYRFKWQSKGTYVTKKNQSQPLKLRTLLLLIGCLSLLLSCMLIYYGDLAYSSWQIDYTLPKVTPALPSPFALKSLSVIIKEIYQHFYLWQISLIIIVTSLIVRNSVWLLRVISLAISLAFAVIIAGNWTVLLQWFVASKFNEVDPQFSKDISFYIFQLPGLRLLDFWLGGLFLYSLVTILLVYLLSANSISQGKFPGFSRTQLRHIYALSGTIFAVLAWRHWFTRYELLYSERGVAHGASYTDVNVQNPLQIGLTIIASLIALWLFWKALTGGGKNNQFLIQFLGRKNIIERRVYKIPFSLVPFYLYIFILFGGLITSFIVQFFVVEPNELARETPYLKRNIEFTRKGFELNKIEVKTFDPQGELSREKIENNPLTIRNIRLWDTRPLLETNRQLQQIRPYYRFLGADIDRYTIRQSTEQEKAEKQQVIISARELDYDQVPQEAQTWVNKHLVYTHGFGFTLSPVNSVDEGGLPYYFVRDIGVDPDGQILTTSNKTINETIPIGKPRIYFGELTDTYIMTSTKVKELDFPSGQENFYNVYDGTGGINIGSYWRRLVFAIYLNDWQMLFTRNFTPDTRLLFRRNFNQRVRTIAPFLNYDEDPYLVVADAGDAIQGKSPNYLHWIVDAYTTSPYYPYSDSGDNKFNYIRNSVKIVIDAYHGDLQFYVSDSSDPIIQTWSKIFGGLFQPLENMPDTLTSHIRYPQDLFRTQSERLLIYHMLDPQVFYNREDQWRIPKEIYGSELLEVEPYYLIIKLPTGSQEEFILVNLYTPDARNNLIAMFFGLSDGKNYGRAVTYVLPKQRSVYGTEQIEARINQDPIISQQISLWNNRGSKVIQGNLLVIPIEQSLLYVEPIYLEAEQNSLPTLVRVIVVYQNQIVMAESLNKGLKALFEPLSQEEPAIIRPFDEIEPDINSLERYQN